jgi:hypothetical protein
MMGDGIARVEGTCKYHWCNRGSKVTTIQATQDSCNSARTDTLLMFAIATLQTYLRQVHLDLHVELLVQTKAATQRISQHLQLAIRQNNTAVSNCEKATALPHLRQVRLDLHVELLALVHDGLHLLHEQLLPAHNVQLLLGVEVDAVHHALPHVDCLLLVVQVLREGITNNAEMGLDFQFTSATAVGMSMGSSAA